MFCEILNQTHVANSHNAFGQLFCQWFSGKCVFVQKLLKCMIQNTFRKGPVFGHMVWAVGKPIISFIGKRWVWKGGIYLYHKMTPPPNLGHSWVVFEGWCQILPSKKLFRHGFEQSRSAMATQKLEVKVQQHDEVVESSKTGCRSQSRA